MSLTPRQKREIEYYNQFANKFSVIEDVNFDPILGEELRPWNPYWYLYQIAKEKYFSGARLLDFGCGPGESSMLFLRIGYHVNGFDVSDVNIELAKKLAHKYSFDERANFSTQTAENLEFDDNYFDAITGIDILHHVHIEKAIKECYRVLKPGGFAIFKEPVENLIFDRIRNTRIVKKFFPNQKSFDLHITEDERKLNKNDIDIIKTEFRKVEIRPFLVLSRFDKFLRNQEDKEPSYLEKLDEKFIKYIPGFSSFRGNICLILEK